MLKLTNARPVALKATGCWIVLAVAIAVPSAFAPTASFAGTDQKVDIAYHYPARVGEPANYDDVSEAAYRLTSGDTHRWAGMFVDGDSLVLAWAGSDVEVGEGQAAAVGLSDGVQVRSVSLSESDLNDLASNVVESKWWGSEVVSAGPDYARNAVAIGVTKPSDLLAQALQGLTTGHAYVYVTEQAQSTSSRWYAADPYLGGSAIRMYNSANPGWPAGICSTGSSWNPPAPLTGDLLLTASHCYQDSPATYVVHPSIGRFTVSSWAPIGSITWKSGGPYGTSAGKRGDFAIITLTGGGSASDRMYYGTGNTLSSRAVSGYAVLAQGWHGTDLRTSGASSKFSGDMSQGEIAPDWVSLVNQTVNYISGQNYSNLTVAEHESDCVDRGDSGGAFYRQNGASGAFAVGIISGTNNQGPLLTNCSNYYTPLLTVIEDYGGGLKF
jgi:hypothetical protein